MCSRQSLLSVYLWYRSTEIEMLEFYPDAGWDHDDLACRVFEYERPFYDH